MSMMIDFNRERLIRRISMAQTSKVRCGCEKNSLMYYVPAGSVDASKAVYQCSICNSVKVVTV